MFVLDDIAAGRPLPFARAMYSINAVSMYFALLGGFKKVEGDRGFSEFAPTIRLAPIGLRICIAAEMVAPFCRGALAEFMRSSTALRYARNDRGTWGCLSSDSGSFWGEGRRRCLDRRPGVRQW